MSDYPVIKLKTAVEIQSAINNDTFKVLSIAENPDEKWVSAFVSGGTQNVWVPILTAENYTPDWSDDTVIDAITEWAMNTFPPAK